MDGQQPSATCPHDDDDVDSSNNDNDDVDSSNNNDIDIVMERKSGLEQRARDGAGRRTQRQ